MSGYNSFLDNFQGYEDLEMHGVRLPNFDIDEKYYKKLNIPKSVSNKEFLNSLTKNGLKEKNLTSQIYKDRLEKELSTIHELGFTDYVLLVWDVINFARENDIAVGIGRGSAAGSLILYSIGVTGVDPIEHGLFFERFISKARAKSKIVDGVLYLDGGLLPDVDTDFCYYRRQEVLDYVKNKFPNRTSKILTVNSLTAKLVIKETAKCVGGYSEDEAKKLADEIPKLHGKLQGLKDTFEENEALKKWAELPCRQFQKYSNKQIIDIALKLENLPKNFGVHPSAVAISYGQLDQLCPVQIAKSDNNEMEPVSGWDMYGVQEVAVKLDILGLRTVSIIDEVCKSIGIKPEEIDFRRPEIYEPMQELKTPHGLFQIEADTVYRTCQQIKPKNIYEVSDLVAIARPGALAHIDGYVKTKFGKKNIEKVLPEWDKILEGTKGYILYQEQQMRLAHEVFGFTLEEAEILRKIVGKKLVKEMPVWEEKIYKKAEEKGLSKEIAKKFWESLNASANYSFNLSHSISYALLGVQTLYLKWQYPQKFFLALLKMSLKEPKPHEEIGKISKELGYFGIKLLRPDLLKSKIDFSLEGKDIRFGLSAIKGLSEKSILQLEDFRQKYTNKFEVFKAANECGLNIGVLSSMIQAGVLDSVLPEDCTRAYLVLEAQVFNLLTDREKHYAMLLGKEYNYDAFKFIKDCVAKNRKDAKGKQPIFKPTRWKILEKGSPLSEGGTIQKNSEKYLEIFLKNKKNEQLANWFFENELLGFVYSNSLYEVLYPNNKNLSPITSFDDANDREKIDICGKVSEVSYRNSKSDKSMLKFILSDNEGSVTCIFFDKALDKWNVNNKTKLEDGNLVIVKGSKSKDVMFLNDVTILNNKAYLKLKDLK